MADKKTMMWDEFDQVESDLEKWKQKRQTPAKKPLEMKDHLTFLSHMDFKIAKEYPITSEEMNLHKVKEETEEDEEKKIKCQSNKEENKQERKLVKEKEDERKKERENEEEKNLDAKPGRGANKIEDSETKFKNTRAFFEGNSNLSEVKKRNTIDFNKKNNFSTNKNIINKIPTTDKPLNTNTNSEMLFRRKNIQNENSNLSTSSNFPLPNTTTKQYNRRSWAPGMFNANNLSIANDKEYTIEKMDLRKKRNDIVIPAPRFVPRDDIILREKEERKADARNQVISVNFDEDPKDFRISIDDFKNMIKSPDIVPDMTEKLKEPLKVETHVSSDIPKQSIVFGDVPKRTFELQDFKESISTQDKKVEIEHDLCEHKIKKDKKNEEMKLENIEKSQTSVRKIDIWNEDKKADVFEDFEEVFQRQKKELEERKTKSPTYIKTNANVTDTNNKFNIKTEEKDIKNNVHDSLEKSNFIVNKPFETENKTFHKQSILKKDTSTTAITPTISSPTTCNTTTPINAQTTINTTTNTSKKDPPKVSKLRDNFLKEINKPLPPLTKPTRTNLSKNTITTSKNENSTLNGTNLPKANNKTSQLINMFASSGFKPALPGELPKRSKSLKSFGSPKMTLKRPQTGISFDEDSSKESSSKEIRRLDNSFYKTRLSIVKGSNRRPPSVFQAMIDDQCKLPKENSDGLKKQETLEDLESFLFSSPQNLKDVPFADADVFQKEINDIVEESEEDYI